MSETTDSTSDAMELELQVKPRPTPKSEKPAQNPGNKREKSLPHRSVMKLGNSDSDGDDLGPKNV